MGERFTKYSLAALLVAWILVAVGVAVWPTPEEAKANETVFTVEARNSQGGGPVNDLEMRISIWVNGDLEVDNVLMTPGQNGSYKYVFDQSTFSSWQVDLRRFYPDRTIIPDNPQNTPHNPGSGTSFTWWVTVQAL